MHVYPERRHGAELRFEQVVTNSDGSSAIVGANDRDSGIPAREGPSLARQSGRRHLRLVSPKVIEKARIADVIECGIGIAGFNDLKEGDLLEAFSTEKMAADLGALTAKA